VGGPVEGGVGDDQAIEGVSPGGLNDVAELQVGEVWRDFQEQGLRAGAGLLEASQQIVERVAGLQRASPGVLGEEMLTVNQAGRPARRRRPAT
jgi:hypothetical protein